MMKVANLPCRARVPELLFQPLQLLRVHIITIQSKETAVAFRVGIIFPPVHVEPFVEALVGIVVVPQCGIEFHASVEQRFVRAFELFVKPKRGIRSVNIVSQHEDELEGELLTVPHHLLGHFILFPVTCSIITHDGKANRVGPERKEEFLRFR